MASNGRPTRSASVTASSGATKQTTKAKDTRERTQFKAADFHLLVDWLVIDGNLKAMQGTDGKTKVGQRYPTKKEAYEDLAEYINTHQSRGSNLKHMHAEGAKNRWGYLEQKYKDVKKAERATGWGLTTQDLQGGITTLAQKCENMCPTFSRLEELLGGNPVMNVQANLHVTSLNSQVVLDSLPNRSFVASLEDPNPLPQEDPFLETEMGDNVDDGEFEILEQDPASKFVPCMPKPNRSASMPTNEDHEMPDPFPSSTVDKHHDEHPHIPIPPVTVDNVGANPARKRKAHEYPNKKLVNEGRNSLNNSFQAHLETMAQTRVHDVNAKSADIDMRRQQLDFDRQLHMERMEQEHQDKQVRFSLHTALEEKKLSQARELEESRQQIEVKKLEGDLKQTELKIATENARDARQAKQKFLQGLHISGEKGIEDIRALMALLD